jgi:hypothetical protein
MLHLSDPSLNYKDFDLQNIQGGVMGFLKVQQIYFGLLAGAKRIVNLYIEHALWSALHGPIYASPPPA